jgi:hypothetical protein
MKKERRMEGIMQGIIFGVLALNLGALCMVWYESTNQKNNSKEHGYRGDL